MTKVLLVGETWASTATHIKGFDHFGSVTFHSGARPFLKAMAGTEYEVEHMPAHDAATEFPLSLEELNKYDVLILSDIGANTLLLHPDVWLKSKRVPNRLKLIEEWTRAGGGLVMVGGYFSFQGIDGKARFKNTAVEEALPVTCMPIDDRVEIPEGCHPVINNATHEILQGLPSDFPYLLGVNEVELKEDANVDLILSLPEDQNGLPLLVAGRHGKGYVVAWTSDMSEHWLPPAFLEWDGYPTLWRNICKFAARARS